MTYSAPNVRRTQPSVRLHHEPGTPAYLKRVYPQIELKSHIQRSLSSLSRVPVSEVRKFSRTVVARKAIKRIANGVLAMPWTVLPPEDQLRDPDALEHAKRLRQALQRPNREPPHNLYSKMIRAIVDELVTLNYAAVERHSGTDDTQPFWLFVANGEHIRYNPAWTPQNTGVEPQYYDFAPRNDGLPRGTPLMEENMFLIQSETNTYEMVPASPMEIAYWLITSWLGLGKFQDKTTSQAVREYILHIEGASKEEIEEFRQYWHTDVEQAGEVPIVGGEGVDVIKLGAKNDEELYLKYTDYLLRLIALAFDLATRDYNVVEPDNRATATVAADATFQDAILPMALTIREHLHLEVIDYYAPGFQLQITDTEKRGEAEEAETAAMLFEKRLVTRNEGRIRSGQESLGPQGDVFADGVPLVSEEEAIAEQDGNIVIEAHKRKQQSRQTQAKRQSRQAIIQQLSLRF